MAEKKGRKGKKGGGTAPSGPSPGHGGSGLDAILSAIREEAEVKINHINAVLEEKKGEMAARAEREMKALAERYRREEERERKMMESRIISEACLTASRTVSRKRQEIMDRVLGAVEQRLSSEREKGGEGYRRFVESIGKEARALMPSGSRAIIVKGDRTARTVLSSMGFAVAEEMGDEAIGGAWFVSPDGHKRINSTLSHIMEAEREEITREIAAVLFPPPAKEAGAGKRERPDETEKST
ncbi:MAG: V-type ATP synthase subunit E [Thermoplasmata archaeon]|nr:V-type ATP synthase subunit E [Thermoplasmata archaeon]